MLQKLAFLMVAVLVVFTAFAIGMQSLFGTTGLVIAAVLEIGASLVIGDRLFGQKRPS